MQSDLSKQALEDALQLIRDERRAAERLFKLLMEIRETPFTGTGKPEPLKHKYKGCWSRRITDEHRLIYKVERDIVHVISCRTHYGDR